MKRGTRAGNLAWDRISTLNGYIKNFIQWFVRSIRGGGFGVALHEFYRDPMSFQRIYKRSIKYTRYAWGRIKTRTFKGDSGVSINAGTIAINSSRNRLIIHVSQVSTSILPFIVLIHYIYIYICQSENLNSRSDNE